MKRLLWLSFVLLAASPVFSQRAFSLDELKKIWLCPDQACVEAFIKPRKYSSEEKIDQGDGTIYKYRTGSINLHTFCVLYYSQKKNGEVIVQSSLGGFISSDIVAQVEAEGYKLIDKTPDKLIYRKYEGESIWAVGITFNDLVGTGKGTTIVVQRVNTSISQQAHNEQTNQANPDSRKITTVSQIKQQLTGAFQNYHYLVDLAYKKTSYHDS